ncbi:hypothetical protein [Tenacibaculum sp. 190524A05c]|uniref:hypothetical protein n=1 Tax=Tenacibaculum platacis TaxID=3137852 RepID=UPI0031FA49A2
MKLNYILLISFFLFNCKKTCRSSKNDIIDLVKKDTISLTDQVKKRECDSLKIDYLNDNPAMEFKKRLSDKDIHGISKLIKETVSLNSEYRDKNKMLEELSLSKAESPFWGHFSSIVRLQGYYENDSTFVAPYWSAMFKKVKCNLVNKLIVIKETKVYSKPDRNSSLVNNEVVLNHIYNYDSIIDKNSSELLIPNVFDKNVWYYSKELNGYLNSLEVSSFNTTNVYYFEKKRKDKYWKLTEIILPD